MEDMEYWDICYGYFVENIRDSIRPLEDSVNRIFVNRMKIRPITGNDSILLRSLGDNFDPYNYQKTYFDEHHKTARPVEFAEAMEALEIYDNNPTIDNAVEALIETGDMMFLSATLDVFHKSHEEYKYVKKQFKQALDYLGAELLKRRLGLTSARKLAEIKYTSRAWHWDNDKHPAKNKTLEHYLCRRAYENNLSL
ncbi:MAG: hypothetical protein ACLFPQ_01240 [Candidatus Woesearchaeota archaeon]